MKRKDTFINFILSLASLVIFALLSEVFIRLIFVDQYAKRPVFFKPDDDLAWTTNHNLDHMFYGSDYSIHVQTDENGYRIGSQGHVKEGIQKILFLGDSFTFGWGVSNHETFVSYFDELLNKNNFNLRAVNLAVPGHGTLEMSRQLENYFLKFNSKTIRMIVVFHHFNDPRGNFRYLLYKSGFLKSSVSSRLQLNSQFHIINYLKVLITTVFSNDDYGSKSIDTMMPFPIVETNKKIGTVEIDDNWAVSRHIINIKSETKEFLWNRGKLTDLHQKLVSKGINNIHNASKNIPVYHAVINYSPSWFEGEVKRSFDLSDTEPEYHHFLGHLNTDSDMNNMMMNNHSGGHFTAAYNKHYAKTLFGLLKKDL